MYLRRAKIAIAQISSVLGDIEANVKKHLECIHTARSHGANAIVFPELSLTGYTLRDINYDVALDPYTDARLQMIRDASIDIAIICGGVASAASGGVYNSAFLFEKGECAFVHHKIYPPTYGIFEEERYFLQGTSVNVYDSAVLGRIGLLVCEDLWHPSLPYLLAHKGAQCIIAIAASPTRLGIGSASTDDVPVNYSINKDHHVAYARLHSIYVAFANRIGVEDGVNFWGGSEVIAPDGSVAARGKFFEEDIIYVDVDPDKIKQARHQSRHMLDENLLLTHKILGDIIS